VSGLGDNFTHRDRWSELRSFVTAARFYILGCLLVSFFLITPIHELSHCFVVWAFGGSVTQIDFIPAAGAWGRVTYTLAQRTPVKELLVYSAPIVLTCSIMAACLFLGHVVKSGTEAAKFIFFCVYVTAAAEFCHIAKGIFYEGSDLSRIFPEPSGWVIAALCCSCLGFVAAGYPLQKRLLGEKHLGRFWFFIIAGIGVLMIGLF
jgi:hypothetical protein